MPYREKVEPDTILLPEAVRTIDEIAFVERYNPTLASTPGDVAASGLLFLNKYVLNTDVFS